MKNGYIFNGIQLVKDENFVGERFPIRTRGRPKGKSPKTPEDQLVVNPKTYRNIKKTGPNI